MALSVVWMSMSMFLMSHWILLKVLDPLRHSRADLNNNNNNNNNYYYYYYYYYYVK